LADIIRRCNRLLGSFSLSGFATFGVEDGSTFSFFFFFLWFFCEGQTYKQTNFPCPLQRAYWKELA